jgi:hypothetical protein
VVAFVNPVRLLTYVPVPEPSVVKLLDNVGAGLVFQQTPLAVIVTPLTAPIVPPLTAVVVVTVQMGVVCIRAVVKLSSLPKTVTQLLVLIWYKFR